MPLATSTVFNCSAFQTCKSQSVECDDGEECIILCSGEESCRHAEVHCPADHNCNILCTGEYGCYSIEVFAQESLSLNITLYLDSDYQYMYSATYGEIYCPVGRSKRYQCQISCLGINPNVCELLDIYAAKGFRDFKFNEFDLNTAQDTNIYCGDDYEYLCEFDYLAAWYYGIYDKCIINGKSNSTCELYTVTTNNPTHNPSIIPSIIPTMNPSVIPTVAILEEGEKARDRNREHSKLLPKWEIASRIIFGVGIVLPFIIILIGHGHHKYCNGGAGNNVQGCDMPNSVAILSFCWNMGDFYSDLMFAFYLALIGHWLFIFAALATFIPYMLSNILSLYFMHQWRQYNIYISRYINRYDWFIIIATAVSGFYPTIEIARSRLFLWNMFGLQIKNDEYRKIKQWRFLNIVICENIPQLVIQFWYAYEQGSSSGDGGAGDNNGMLYIVEDAVVFNAMFFSIASLLVGILKAVSYYVRKHSALYHEYVYSKRKYYKLDIEHPDFRHKHQFSHKTMQKILGQILKIDEMYNVDVYYILAKRHGIIVWFELNNFKLNTNVIVNVITPKGDSNVTTVTYVDESQKVFTLVLGIGRDAPGGINEQFKNDVMQKYGLKTGDLKVTIEMNENKTLEVDRTQKVIAIESRTGTNSIAGSRRASAMTGTPTPSISAAIAPSSVVGVGDQVKSNRKSVMNFQNGHLNTPDQQWQLSTHVQLPDRPQLDMVRTASDNDDE